jgi:ActR/RegA family two-component response regulator
MKDQPMPLANEFAAVYRPCLVLAHADSAWVSDAARHFRRQGWDVYPTQGGPAARRLARMLEPEMVVLDVDLAEESGWLTCAKLMQERPDGKVILLCEDTSTRKSDMAAFAGAVALMHRQECLLSLPRPTAVPSLPAAA